MAVKSVTDFSFKDEVLDSDVPVVVEFWAPWCGPCRKVAPILDEIAESELGQKVKIVKMNSDENPIVSMDYGVMSIPLILVFKNGEAVKSMIGARPKSAIVSMIEGVV